MITSTVFEYGTGPEIKFLIYLPRGNKLPRIFWAEDGILQMLISDPAVDYTLLADKSLYAARPH